MGFNGFDTRIARCQRAKIRRSSGVQRRSANIDACREAQLAERTRIARELHDTLLQGFCSVSMQLHTAVDYLPADSAAKPRFHDIVRLAHRVLEEGRLAVLGLRSPQEEPPSLSQAFAALPRDLGLPQSIRFRVIVEGCRRGLKETLSDEVYRIGREAIVNAYRHSGAQNIEVQIEYRRTGLRLCVRDDGCGIDGGELQRQSGHWGLQGMRERAERISARLRVLSRIALGTEVELCVPGSVAFASS